MDTIYKDYNWIFTLCCWVYCGGRGNFTPDFYQDSIQYKCLSSTHVHTQIVGALGWLFSEYTAGLCGTVAYPDTASSTEGLALISLICVEASSWPIISIGGAPTVVG